MNMECQWFGESWGAAVCDPKGHINTPVGEDCLQCEQEIRVGDQGVSFPQVEAENGPIVGKVYFHRHCFIVSLGLEPQN